MMRITQDFLNHLSPVELSFTRTGIDKLYKDKVTPDTTNYENIESHVQRCPHCGSVNFVKNGFNPKHRQKYRCKDCRAVFMATTGTMFTHSRTSFNTWSTFIAGELNGLTLEQQTVATELSIVTCFNMRHKLYKAISKVQENAVLRCVQLRKHSKAREKRYSFGYAVSFIFACYQILWTFPKSRYLCSRYLPLVCG